MESYKKNKSVEMTNEEVTRFIEERLQLLEKTGQINNHVTTHDYPDYLEVPTSSFLNSIKKKFCNFFYKDKRRKNR